MNRAQIEELSGVQPQCIETDREQQWYEAGLVEGLEVADSEPKPDKSMSEILNDFSGTKIFITEQKYLDDVILLVSKKDKKQAVKIIKDFVKEAKQYLDKITENHKPC